MKKIINRDSDLKIINNVINNPLLKDIIQYIDTIEVSEHFHNHIVIYLYYINTIKSIIKMRNKLKFFLNSFKKIYRYRHFSRTR